MSTELVRVKNFVEELMKEEKSAGRPKKDVKDNEKLFLEVKKVQRFVTRELDADLSDKAAIIYLKWASQKKFSEKLKKKKHTHIRGKLEEIHKLTSANISSLITKVSKGKKASTQKQK
jgi:hypothetical protein